MCTDLIDFPDDGLSISYRQTTITSLLNRFLGSKFDLLVHHNWTFLPDLVLHIGWMFSLVCHVCVSVVKAALLSRSLLKIDFNLSEAFTLNKEYTSFFLQTCFSSEERKIPALKNVSSMMSSGTGHVLQGTEAREHGRKTTLQLICELF